MGAASRTFFGTDSPPWRPVTRQMRYILNSPSRNPPAMTRSLFALALSATLFAAPAVADEERPQHFDAVEPKSLQEALTYFAIYSEALEELLAKEKLTAADLSRVHEMSYTLENALAKMREELAGTADALESVHLASERADAETVRAQGAAFLKAAKQFAK